MTHLPGATILVAIILSASTTALAQDILWMNGGHTSTVTAVLFLPDSRHVVSSSTDGTIRTWDIETRRMTRRVLAGASVLSLSRTSDGGTIASGDAMGNVLLWDVATWTVRRRIVIPNERVFSVCLANDGTTVAASFSNGIVRVFSTATGEPLHDLVGHSGPVNAIAVSPDDRWFGTVSQDYTVRLWERSTGQLRRTISEIQYAGFSLAFTPDSKAVAALGWDSLADWKERYRGVVLYDVESGRRLGVYSHWHQDQVMGIAISPNGKYLTSVALDCSIPGTRLGSTVAMNIVGMVDPLGQFEYQQEGELGGGTCVAFSPDSKAFVFGSPRGSIRVMRPSGNVVLPFVRAPWPTITAHMGAVRSIALAPDQNSVVTGGDDARVYRWSAREGDRLDSVKGHGMAVRGLSYSADGATIVSASEDGTIGLWEPAPLAVRTSIGVSPDWTVSHAVMGSDGTVYAAIGGSDSTVAAVDTSDGDLTGRFEGHAGAVAGVAVSPDGARIVSAGIDGTVRAWSTTTRAQAFSVPAHIDGALRVAFAPDGQTVYSGGSDGVIRMLDAQTGSSYWHAAAHGGAVTSVAVASNGALVATAARDSSLILWRTGAEALTEISRVRSFPAIWLSLALSRDGRTLYGTTECGSVVAVDIASIAGANDVDIARENLAVHPLPARDRATILIELDGTHEVRVELVDMLGRIASSAALGVLAPGIHRIPINTASLAPGSYIVGLVLRDRVIRGRLTVVD